LLCGHCLSVHNGIPRCFQRPGITGLFFLCYISPVSLTSGVIGVLDTDNEMGSYNKCSIPARRIFRWDITVTPLHHTLAFWIGNFSSKPLLCLSVLSHQHSPPCCYPTCPSMVSVPAASMVSPIYKGRKSPSSYVSLPVTYSLF
jgi:hypothetical protein